MKLSDYVEFNPRVVLARGEMTLFVSMDVVEPGVKNVYPLERRPAQGSGSKFSPSDTLFARITPCLQNGKIAQYSGDSSGMGSTEFFVLRARAGLADPDFVYYFSQKRELRLAAENSMTGASGRQRASISALADFECTFPSLEMQRQIAGVLNSYEELIENNRRRIKILETIAKNIYKEWFVHLRYPGYETTKFIDTALGKVPEAWQIKPLSDLIVDHIGGGWGEAVENDMFKHAAWVIRGTDIPEGRYLQTESVPFRFHKESNLMSRKLKVGDIIFEVSGGSKDQPVGRSLLVSHDLLDSLPGSVMCASFCKRVQPKNNVYLSELLYLSLLEGYENGEIEKYQVQSTGISNFKWTEYIANTLRVIPDDKMQLKFSSYIGPIFKQISTLGLQIKNLSETRNLLLPTLLAREIPYLVISK